MQAQTWISLFRHIPPEQQNRFTLVTANGMEITVQSLLRLEADFAIIKGRLSGSQDAGRVFFIPYVSIDTFSFTNPVKDSEVADLFDTLTFTAPAVPAAPALPAEAPPAVSPSARTPLPVSLPTPTPPPTARPSIRSEVLERFRNSRPASSVNLPRPEGT